MTITIKRPRYSQRSADTENTRTAGNFPEAIDYDYETFHLHMNCYWATLAGGELKLLEHEAAKWLGSADLESVEWLPADLSLLPKLSAAMQTS